MSDRIRVMMVLLLASILPSGVAMAEETQRRDPLKPPGRVQQATRPAFSVDDWRLMSTLVSEGRRVAIINDDTVRVGGRVNGARVLGIESGRVRLEYRGREFTITRPDVRVRLSE